MYDVHYHLIYGVDDGPATLEESLELAQASIEDGVTHVVATPHANHQYPFAPEVNRERLETLKERLGDRLTLGLGCDFHLSYENIEDLFQRPAKYTINGRGYLLVEFPDFGIPPMIEHTFFRMLSAGVTPILTHPERNRTLTANPKLLAKWLQGGCLIQVTAGALLGRFGPQPEAFAHKWIKGNWVHIIASDAHYLKGRWPRMRQTYQLLVERYGNDVAERLCVRNPGAVFRGEPLESQPEPQGVYELDVPKRGILARLFGG